LDDDLTATGQPFTVYSNGDEDGRQVPKEINLMDGQAEILVNQTSNSKRVKTFVVPGWEEGFSTYCFQFIGQGASFCTAKNCTTAHQHTAKKQAAPGELYISNNGVCDPFLNPSTNF
jgi:hypothetical protein